MQQERNLHLGEQDVCYSCIVSAFYPAVIQKLLLTLFIQDSDVPVSDMVEWMS